MAGCPGGDPEQAAGSRPPSAFAKAALYLFNSGKGFSLPPLPLPLPPLPPSPPPRTRSRRRSPRPPGQVSPGMLRGGGHGHTWRRPLAARGGGGCPPPAPPPRCFFANFGQRPGGGGERRVLGGQPAPALPGGGDRRSPSRVPPPPPHPGRWGLQSSAGSGRGCAALRCGVWGAGGAWGLRGVGVPGARGGQRGFSVLGGQAGTPRGMGVCEVLGCLEHQGGVRGDAPFWGDRQPPPPRQGTRILGGVGVPGAPGGVRGDALSWGGTGWHPPGSMALRGARLQWAQPWDPLVLVGCSRGARGYGQRSSPPLPWHAGRRGLARRLRARVWLVAGRRDIPGVQPVHPSTRRDPVLPSHVGPGWAPGTRFRFRLLIYIWCILPILPHTSRKPTLKIGPN